VLAPPLVLCFKPPLRLVKQDGLHDERVQPDILSSAHSAPRLRVVERAVERGMQRGSLVGAQIVVEHNDLDLGAAGKSFGSSSSEPAILHLHLEHLHIVQFSARRGPRGPMSQPMKNSAFDCVVVRAGGLDPHENQRHLSRFCNVLEG
jgi:hypothetical protein